MGIAWLYGPVTCRKLYLSGVDMALDEERAEAARAPVKALLRGDASPAAGGPGGGRARGGGGGGGGDAELSVLEILVLHARKDILTESQVRARARVPHAGVRVRARLRT